MPLDTVPRRLVDFWLSFRAKTNCVRRQIWRARPRETLDVLSTLPAAYLVLRTILPDAISINAREERGWLAYYLAVAMTRLADYNYDPVAVGYPAPALVAAVAAEAEEAAEEAVAQTVAAAVGTAGMPSWYQFGKLVMVIWMLRGGRQWLYESVGVGKIFSLSEAPADL